MGALSDPIVGIDLGTSNTVVAYADGAGPVRVLADDGGYKVHPSVVSFHPGGGVVVGAAAKQRKVIDPEHTIYSVKRLIGRGYRSPEVQTTQARVPFQIKEGAHQLPMIVTRGGEFTAPEISGIVLDHVRTLAAARLGAEVSRAVITVPASFDDAQRAATATAGAIAGLTVVRVLDEPTAAALAYGHARGRGDVLAVYDFGGGTFDISILRLDERTCEVLGTAGDTFLGGDDLDERLVDRMVARFLAEHRVDLRTHEVSMMRLRAVAEQTKIELSRRARAVVRVDEIAYGPRGVPLDLQIEITRDELVGDVADLIDRTFPVCQEALALAGVSLDRIGEVLLVGGTTKIPYVREQVARFFHKAPRADLGPEDVIAIGAALQAASLEPAPDLETGPRALIAPGPDRERHATSGAFEARGASEPTVTRPDTSYSVTRAGTKDSFEEPSSPALAPPLPLSLFDDLTPPPRAQSLGRLTRPPTSEPAAARPPRAASSTLDIPALALPAEPAPPGPGRTPNPTSWGDAGDPIRPPPPPPQSPTAGLPSVAKPPPPPLPPPPMSPPPLSPPPLSPPPMSPPPMPIAAPSAPTLFGAPPGKLLEVTPRGLGIGTVAGYCEELIRRNSRLPAETKKLFTTSRDHQDVVRIIVCQGESRRLERNVVIGDLVLAGLPPLPRGETSIEVTFSLDASGILQVHARDALTGAEQRAELDLSGGVAPQDVAAPRDRLEPLRR